MYDSKTEVWIPGITRNNFATIARKYDSLRQLHNPNYWFRSLFKWNNLTNILVEVSLKKNRKIIASIISHRYISNDISHSFMFAI